MRLWSTILLAIRARPRMHSTSDVWSLMVILGIGVPLILLVIGLPVYLYLKRESEEEEVEPVTDADLLRQFETARAEGEMDEAEYQRVRALLEQRIRQEAATQGDTGSKRTPSSGGDAGVIS
jgi:low affinity Fe/Cu permease